MSWIGSIASSKAWPPGRAGRRGRPVNSHRRPPASRVVGSGAAGGRPTPPLRYQRETEDCTRRRSRTGVEERDGRRRVGSEHTKRSTWRRGSCASCAGRASTGFESAKCRKGRRAPPGLRSRRGARDSLKERPVARRAAPRHQVCKHAGKATQRAPSTSGSYVWIVPSAVSRWYRRMAESGGRTPLMELGARGEEVPMTRAYDGAVARPSRGARSGHARRRLRRYAATRWSRSTKRRSSAR